MPRGGVASLLDVFPRAWLERLRTRTRRTPERARTYAPTTVLPPRPAGAAATRPGAGRRDGDTATAPEPGSHRAAGGARAALHGPVSVSV